MAVFICGQIKGLNKSDVEKYSFVEFFKMHNKAVSIFETNRRQNG